MNPIKVVLYDSNWPKFFEFESIKIQDVLGNNCIAVHHIGSTSVIGLSAKPKIDIIVVVKNPRKIIQPLQLIGFKYRGEFNIPLHYGFTKRGVIDFNLHVYEISHPEIELNLIFRDYLRSHPNVCNEYTALKRELLKDETSYEKNDYFSNYTLGKGNFIQSILKKAGFDRIRMLKCSSSEEWNAARNYRKKYFNDEKPTIELKLDQEDQVHLILYKGVIIIGYCNLQLTSGDAQVQMLIIGNSYKNQGYDKLFLKLIKKWRAKTMLV